MLKGKFDRMGHITEILCRFYAFARNKVTSVDDGSSSHQSVTDGHDSKAVYGLRIKLPEFTGEDDVDFFLDWLTTVENVFQFHSPAEDRKVPLIATQLEGLAATWWEGQ